MWAGLIMMVCGVVCKLGAVFVMIPEPVIGGIYCTFFGVIAAVGKAHKSQFLDSQRIAFDVKCNRKICRRENTDKYILK